MQAVCSVKNQYRGINAHLHRYWQGIAKWNRFHKVQIAPLLVTLKARLLPMGYTVETEESLQIRRVTDHPSFPRVEILIGDLGRQRMPQPQSSWVDVQTLPMEEFVDAEDDTEHPYSPQQGVELETGPFPIREMTLSAALAEIESLRDQQK